MQASEVSLLRSKQVQQKHCLGLALLDASKSRLKFFGYMYLLVGPPSGGRATWRMWRVLRLWVVLLSVCVCDVGWSSCVFACALLSGLSECVCCVVEW